MRGEISDTYSRPYYLLCEGEGDKRFFDRLLVNIGASDFFNVRFPGRGLEGSGGRSKFGAHLQDRYLLSETFRENVRGILIVSDNDDQPNISWAEVMAQLRNSGGFPIPTKEHELAKKAQFPSVAVLMVPIGKPGNLETLCLKAAYDKWEIQSAVEAYANASPAKTWGLGKQSKMKLQAVLAATCEGRPESGFVGHWRENPDYHIPLDNPCFNPIADFLRGFPSLVSAG